VSSQAKRKMNEAAEMTAKVTMNCEWNQSSS
jgi:hypothetical protein